MYNIKGSSAEIHTQTRQNLKGRSKTAQPHVFAQQYSSATFVSTIKNWRAF